MRFSSHLLPDVDEGLLRKDTGRLDLVRVRICLQGTLFGQGEPGNPPFPTVRGGSGKGSKYAGQGGAGAGNILRVTADWNHMLQRRKS